MSSLDQRAALGDVLDALARDLGDRARRNVPLGPLTTYRVGGPAAVFVQAESVADLDAVAAGLQQHSVPLLVLGRGSNLLVADEGFAGLVVQLGSIGDSLTMFGTSVVAGGGVLLPVLARRTAAAGFTGLEWAVGVPGSVGGGVRMNAGGHGSDIAASLVTADVFDLLSGVMATVPAAELGLRFRGSDLGDHQVVVSATFAVAVGDRETAEAELSEIVRWRREHQPGGQNCGSVFVNPIPGQLAAGQLIDELGLRGFRISTAFVSDKHANFIQGTEDGRASDVRAVMEEVRRRVFEEKGFLLRSEVRLVGFDDLDDAANPEAVTQ
jgi:UDP-N-acetylmuramate dehydrogenase